MEAATAPAAQLNWDEVVGGRTPTGTALTFTGLKIEDGVKYTKGQKLVVEIVAEVGEVAFRDKHDSATGDVVDTTHAAKARVLSARVTGTKGDLKPVE